MVTTKSTSLNIRQQATSSSTVIYQASKDSALSILSTSGSYYKVQLNNGKIAYANSNYITRSNDCGVVDIQDGILNVRSSRSTSSRIISRISRGSAVHILKSYDSWYQVKLNSGKIGYVSSQYIKHEMDNPEEVESSIIDQGEIKFKGGRSSSTVEGAIVRGTTNQYFLKAGAGQWMKVEISSVENNAVFDLAVYKNASHKYVTLSTEAEIFGYKRSPRFILEIYIFNTLPKLKFGLLFIR